MANEVMDGVFTEPMKNSLVKNRSFIVVNLTKVEGILDYLVRRGVFADAEDVIETNRTKKDQVRKLLDGLVKRPAGDYWKFITSLYQESIKQGNIASRILRTYEEKGGTVSLEVSKLRQDYDDQAAPPADPAQGQQREDHMEVDSGHQGAGQGESAYERARRKTPDEVYRMASVPRGLALIIDNENFEKPCLLSDREGTAEDRQLLENMLTNIGFDVSVKENLRAEDMRKALKTLSRDPRLHEVDSCIVAVMSHGSKEGIIFGVDGDFAEDYTPVEGTYINVTEMRDIFSSTECPALSTKPKLFIVQACRGEFEDTDRGVRTVGRDVAGGSGADSPCPARNTSMYQDMCWVHSTVENMVAYRKVLIPTLVDIFTEYAATEGIREMMRKIQKKISKKDPLEEDGRLLYPVVQDSYTLINRWYFNPPPPAS